MKTPSTILSALATFAAGTAFSHAATIIPLNNFETNLDGWTASGASSGRYVATTTLQPADDTTTNFASGGTGAASLGKAGGAITSTSFDLTGGGAAESITIGLNFVMHNGSSTRRSFIEYSGNGGANWFTLGMLQFGAASASANKTVYGGSLTFTEGSSTVARTGNVAAPTLYTGAAAYNGSAFTGDSVFRVVNLGSAGADVRFFIDNLEVTGSVAPVPEPTSALLGSLGLLALLRRRR